jgi:hypothetical protein
MNLQVDFWILIVILLFIGNEVTQVKRKLEKLNLDTLRDNIRSDVKHEIEMHEIRTRN